MIVFGRDAAIELPPFDDDLQMGNAIESLFDPQATNIAAAMKLAQATFPEDAARRIVLVTDGNQNQGNALEQAQAAGGRGHRHRRRARSATTARAEVAVERVILPGDVRRDQPFDLRVVLSNNCDPKPGDKGEVPGRLIVTKIVDDQPVERKEQHVTLPPGKKVFNLRQRSTPPNFYTYEATFVPDRPEDDTMPQNKRATAFTHVAGKGQVLLIVRPASGPGEYDLLAERLRQHGLEVVVRGTDRLFSSLAELQIYDTVVLANVPRATSDEVSFSDEQIDMLVRNTQQMGAGLVMLGGPESFGAGGWTGTELEKAMPVDFQIRNAEVVPRGALVLLMHASEIAQGNGIQKQIAKEAIKTLSGQDYCGVMQWNGNEVVDLRPGPRGDRPVSQQAAGGRRSHDPRRHARLRTGHAPGRTRFRRAAEQAGGREAHDRAQRRRPRAAAAGDDRPAEGHGRDDLHGGRQRPRHGREPEPCRTSPPPATANTTR